MTAYEMKKYENVINSYKDQEELIVVIMTLMPIHIETRMFLAFYSNFFSFVFIHEKVKNST
jgi:hypothetical protein